MALLVAIIHDGIQCSLPLTSYVNVLRIGSSCYMHTHERTSKYGICYKDQTALNKFTMRAKKLLWKIVKVKNEFPKC